MCHFGIPSNVIGSWNLMLTDLIEKKDLFDYIITPKPTKVILEKNRIVKDKTDLYTKIAIKKFPYLAYKQYWFVLKKVMNNIGEENIVINIVDNVNLLLSIDFYLKKFKRRNQVKINYFLHGYSIECNNEKKIKIYNAIDHLVLLSEKSYLYQLEKAHTIPCQVSVLRNGVDSSRFKKINLTEKQQLRKKLNFSIDKTYFLWVSQDRPKKGLSIVLKAWEKIIEKRTNIELLIIGTEKKIDIRQVTTVGRVDNKVLHEYYQIGDYYIFSTLCHEGHPLSLTEAIKSGLTCICSNIDPISEIVHEGDLAILVDKPNFVSSWVEAIERILNDEKLIDLHEDELNKLYDYGDWFDNFEKLIKS